ncbi:hypothetical protein BANRA_02849 [Klebsiella pneumoniae]|nr:hypothetical protein KP1VIM_01961 [Klebsiella pneumoniae]CAF2570424.1 hypothetical protein AI2867V1_2173 [Klebsiella pneumoniae]CAG7576589.1 hypothetical protein KP1VIM_01961 [Klebsiella pneumoniae]CAH1466338.1 Uncharacterised protein [Klebsiella pneumoniae]CAH1469194.1 Uncharacterised protein [Klebsiella pneumoniae]
MILYRIDNDFTTCILTNKIQRIISYIFNSDIINSF